MIGRIAKFARKRSGSLFVRMAGNAVLDELPPILGKSVRNLTGDHGRNKAIAIAIEELLVQAAKHGDIDLATLHRITGMVDKGIGDRILKIQRSRVDQDRERESQ